VSEETLQPINSALCDVFCHARAKKIVVADVDLQAAERVVAAGVYRLLDI